MSRTDGEYARRVGIFPEVVGVGVAVKVEPKSRACSLISFSLSISGKYISKRGREMNTVETAYKVAICPRGNLLHMRIYFIPDLQLLCRGILGL